jgi:hypothetical protein
MDGMDESYGGEDESYSQSNAHPYPKQTPQGHLEDRLEMIKNNIKNQKQQSSGKRESIDRLEDVLRHQRDKLDSIQ